MTVPPRSLKELFLAVLEVAPADRVAWLERECSGEAGLRQQLNLMLEAHDAPHSLLDQPAMAEPGATIDQPIAERPGTQIGPYKLLQQIGEGGMGVVYMAEQLEPVKRRVALKIIKPGMDTRQGNRPVRGRAAGVVADGPSEHRQGAGRRDDRQRPAVFRDGAGQGTNDHALL
jgi:hypothetical protein